MPEVSHHSEAALALVQRARDLPRPTRVFAESARFDDTADITSEEFAAVLSANPALCDKVLQLCNSESVGLSGVFETTGQAVDVIVFHRMRSLVVALSVIDVFDHAVVDDSYRRAFWHHSLLTAVGTRTLARRTQPGNPAAAETAFSAGIFHDVGEPVMWMASPSDGKEVNRRAALDPAAEPGGGERDLRLSPRGSQSAARNALEAAGFACAGDRVSPRPGSVRRPLAPCGCSACGGRTDLSRHVGTRDGRGVTRTRPRRIRPHGAVHGGDRRVPHRGSIRGGPGEAFLQIARRSP